MTFFFKPVNFVSELLVLLLRLPDQPVRGSAIDVAAVPLVAVAAAVVPLVCVGCGLAGEFELLCCFVEVVNQALSDIKKYVLWQWNL